jgi:3-methyladenine DNA glycosylase Mpg
MRVSLLLTVAALALAGCQSAAEKRAAETGEIDARNASTDDVAKLIKAASAKNAVKPGMWRATLRIEAAESANGASQLEAAKKLERDTTSCQTAEQLKPVDVSKLEKATGGTCVFLRYTAVGGNVDAQIECKKPGAPVSNILIHGTQSPTGFNVVTENRTGTKGQPDYGLVRIRSTGTRTGECQG